MLWHKQRVYVASSWRNAMQPDVVKALRDAGHEVYDFRNPSVGNHGFHWSEIDQDWKSWSPEAFNAALDHPIARNGLVKDWAAMQWATACVLVLPAGRSAHLEAGYFIGVPKTLAILLAPGEPELMYALASYRTLDIEDTVMKIGYGLQVYNKENKKP